MAGAQRAEEQEAARGDGEDGRPGPWPTVSTAVRGLRSRPLLSAASLMLCIVAVAAAVVGPTYQDAATRSFVVAQLASQPLVATGLTFDYHPPPGALETVDQAVSNAVTTAAKLSGPAYEPGHPLVWDPLQPPKLPDSGALVSPTLVAADGACEHVVLQGRCPSRPGEIAVLRSDATQLQLRIGSRIEAFKDYPYVVTALYEPSPKAQAFWFGNGRLQSIPASGPPRGLPARPAPWLTVSGTIQDRYDITWYVTVDQRLALPAGLTPDQVARAGTRAELLTRQADKDFLPLGFEIEPGNTLATTARHLLSQRGVVGSTVDPAVFSLILVTMVLLVRLLSAATDARRGELALAALRGYGRRRLWLLGMIEPLLIIGVAIPVGMVTGYLAVRILGVAWLVPGLPVGLPWTALLGTVAVVAVVSGFAALVVRGALSEPLSAQLAGVRRPEPPSRVLTIARLLLVAAVVAVFVTAVSRSGERAPDATDMILPVLLAVAAGVLSGIAVTALSTVWVRVSSRGRAISSYVAARTVRRRRAATLMIVPVTAAMAIAVFTLGISGTAAAWRADAAATQVGADESYPTRLPLSRAVALTHQLDPQGRWLLAAGLVSPNTPGGDLEVSVPRVVVDAPRLGRVAAWPAEWTPGRSPSAIGRALAPTRAPVLLTGRRISLAVANAVRGDFANLFVSISVIDDSGVNRQLVLGPFPPGRSRDTGRLPSCERGCRVQQLLFGGPSGLSEAMQGHLTLDRVLVDGRPATDLLGTGWRTADTPPGTGTAIHGRPRVDDGRLRVAVSARNTGNAAAITPTDVPETIPVLWGDRAAQRQHLADGAGGTYAVRSIGTATSLPVRGPSGLLMDYSTFIRHATLQYGTVQTWVWARSDTPATVREALAEHGIASPDTLSGAQHLLGQDAFALALRLYGVVTVMVLLLASAGVGVHLAVQLPARRREAASLRLLRVGQRALMLGVFAEFLVVLGTAALAGVCAGIVAQQVVVRAVTLGFVGSDQVPRIAPTLDVAAVLVLTLVVLVVLLVGAAAISSLTVRGARTATLRENAR